jgi:hypothetical protein
MKIANSGKYICKIVYRFSEEEKEEINSRNKELISSLFLEEYYVICTVHTYKGKVWFHDVEKCANHLLEYFKLFQPFFDKKSPPEEMLDCFAGFLYSYNEDMDIYECKNQILKNTGGNKWDIYLKAYKPLA